MYILEEKMFTLETKCKYYKVKTLMYISVDKAYNIIDTI